MPTVLLKQGWRLFFYYNERNEPPHIHAQKGDVDCKFWLVAERFEIQEVYGYNLSPKDRRTIRQIIFENFDYLISEYRKIHKGRVP